MSEQTAQEQATPKGAASVLDAGLGIVVTLRKQAEEIAKSGLPGWGNTMTEAAYEIEALRYSLRLDEELIGMIQKIISSLNSRPMPNAVVSCGRDKASEN